MAGSKIVLKGLDLRKPKIFNDFGLSNNTGLSSYLADKDSFDNIIQSSGFENLDIISSGPIPLNPSELILSDIFKEVIEKLCERYEYIIIDTPRVGIVAASLELMTHVFRAPICPDIIRSMKKTPKGTKKFTEKEKIAIIYLIN